MDDKSTDTLTNVLCTTYSKNIDEFFYENSDSIFNNDRPFYTYMRSMFKKKGIKQQDVFLIADISEGYGYKLISEEKRTKQRDVILRLCIAAKFSLKETQRALKTYGMSPLYPRIQRDAIFIVAFNTGKHDVELVDEMLSKYGMEPLYSCKESE